MLEDGRPANLPCRALRSPAAAIFVGRLIRAGVSEAGRAGYWGFGPGMLGV